MKLSTSILTVLLVAGVTGIFGSNYIMKKEFDKIDKNDPYWNYGKVNAQPFGHLVITGGNISNIVFEESKYPSVKVLQEWRGFSDGTVKTYVSNDTLYLNFHNEPANVGEKFWLMRTVPVRIFSPHLLSVTGNDTRLAIQKFNHSSLQIMLGGKSQLLVNSYRPDLQELNVSQKDSSSVVFAMSRDLEETARIKVNRLTATLEGTSVLDMRSADIDLVDLHVGDSAGILLSGAALRKWK